MKKIPSTEQVKKEEILPPSIEEQAEKFYRTMNKENAEFFKKTDELNKIFRKNTADMLSDLIMCVKRERDEIKKFFKEVIELTHNTDATLCNVLLAIRQNEYLQTWYPDKGPSPKCSADEILDSIKRMAS